MEVMPKIIIRGTLFEMDRSNAVFIQCNDPENRIYFKELKKYKDDYLLYYDFNNATSVKGLTFDGEFEALHFPREILDPLKNKNATYPEWINKASYKNKWGILVVDDPLQRRLEGNLPQISIKETNYNIDIVRGELIPIGDMYRPLSIRNVGIDEPNFSFCFDPKSKQILGLEVLFRQFEEELLLVTLPSLEVMDPIGFAKSLGIGEMTFLRRTPINMQHYALTEPYTITRHKEQLDMLIAHSERGKKKLGIKSRKKSNRLS